MSEILFESDAIRCDKEDGFAVFHLKTDALTLFLDIASRNTYNEFSKGVMSDNSIKGIAFINDHDLFDDADYGGKLKELFQSKGVTDRQAFEKIANIAWVASKNLLECAKPTAGGTIGKAGYDTFGFSMLYNYRCLSKETSFVNTAYKYGVPPVALLPFFLRHSVGQSRASEILLLKETIAAQEVKDLGLIQDVVSKDDVLDSCLTALETMARIPKGTFAVMKRIVQPELKDLEVYLDAAKKMNITEIMNK